MSLGGDSFFTYWEVPKHPGDHRAVCTLAFIAKSSVIAFAILSVSAPSGYAVFNGLFSQRSNVFLPLSLALFHKFNSTFPCDFFVYRIFSSLALSRTLLRQWLGSHLCGAF